MPITAAKHIWYNGKLVPWEKATVHVLAHALHYGSTVFEGERAYATPQGPVIFRLRDHTRRLFDSAKIYRIDVPYTPEQITAACKEIVVVNGLERGAYLRPFAFRGYGEIGVAPKNPPPSGVLISAPKDSRTASMYASRPGSALRRTRFRQWARLRAIIYPVS